MNITRQHICRHMADRAFIVRAQADAAFVAFVECVVDHLAKGDVVSLDGLGRFRTTIQNGTRRIRFKPAAKTKQKVRHGTDNTERA